MMGLDTLATLALAASLMAPALPKRTDWQGEPVMIRQASVAYGQVDADGKFTPQETLHSLQYIVVKEEKGYLQVNQEGKMVWVDKKDMVLLRDAPDHYTKMLDSDPNNATWYAYRGWANHRLKQSDKALKDYSEAIRIKPLVSAWHNNRGLIYADQKKYDEAIQDYTAAIDLNDENALSFRNRAVAYTRKKLYAKAVADFEKAVEIAPNIPFAQNGYAWILCTCPEDKVRDGKKALAHAKKACELTEFKNGGYLDTLAAAYAENGEWDKAVEWQEKAIKSGDFPLADIEAGKKRLELFKNKKAYRGDD
ncbi:tetratricopeptide repeat protein [Zavarzinella formosa]|uniref:tetratricopeptide repeat protein n=1 Tax=Zavarzinella formosa TaxID=360055 RepID=UPI0002E1CC46|nr:tetratricopeptide repeat protein [Zavarzinella formosa]